MTDQPDNTVDAPREVPKPKRRTGKVKAVQAEIIERRLAGEPIRHIQADLALRGTKLTADVIIDVYDEFLMLRAAEDDVSLNQRLAEQIERLEWVVAEARSAWLKSCEPKVVTKTRKDGSTEQFEMEGEGNPSYHQNYLAALAQLDKLRGLAAATKVEHSGSVELTSPKDAIAAALAALAETTAVDPEGDDE